MVKPTRCVEGKCEKYRFKKASRGSVYADGGKRCLTCEIYIDYPGRYCPCCGWKLRTKPRHRKYKEKYREAMKNAN